MTTISTPTATDAAPTPAAVAEREVARLRRTFAEGRTRSESWRKDQLRGVARFMADCEDELLAALAQDLGRQDLESLWTDLLATKADASHAAKHVGEWMRTTRERTPLVLAPARIEHRPEPLGVTMVVGAWNYPLQLTLLPLVASLAAGNCTIVKPSEIAPNVSRVLARRLPEHVDPDAVAVVEGAAAETLALIDAKLDLVFFTGSSDVGSKIMAAAAPHLTPVVLELGGKSPAIVAADANMRVTAQRLAWGKLTNSGQTCIAPDYVLVERAGAQVFVDEITAAMARLYPDSASRARIINHRHTRRLAGLLEDHRGRVVLGGGVDEAACRVEATVVVDPDPASPLMTEEIFGPILPVLVVDDIDDATAFVRSRPHPLALYAFTRDSATADWILDMTTSGGATVNHVMLQAGSPLVPFGGVGRSGMGAYHGKYGFEAFSHRRGIVRKGFWPELPILYPPFTSIKERLLRWTLR